MTLLVINAHPDPHNAQSATVQMLAHLESKCPADTKQLNLYEENIPALDADMLAWMRKRLSGEVLNMQEKSSAARSAAVLDTFAAAKRVIIALPMHNFSIPARLKDYLDNLIVPGKTFLPRGDAPPQGLLTAHKVWILQASGGVYGENSPIAALEHSIPLLHTALGFIGIRDIRITRAEGTTDIGVAAAVARAVADIDRQWDEFIND